MLCVSFLPIVDEWLLPMFAFLSLLMLTVQSFVPCNRMFSLPIESSSVSSFWPADRMTHCALLPATDGEALDGLGTVERPMGRSTSPSTHANTISVSARLGKCIP